MPTLIRGYVQINSWNGFHYHVFMLYVTITFWKLEDSITLLSTHVLLSQGSNSWQNHKPHIKTSIGSRVAAPKMWISLLLCMHSPSIETLKESQIASFLHHSGLATCNRSPLIPSSVCNLFSYSKFLIEYFITFVHECFEPSEWMNEPLWMLWTVLLNRVWFISRFVSLFVISL